MYTFNVAMTEEDGLKLKRAQYEKDTVSDLILRNMSSEPSRFWIDKLTEASIFLDDCKQEMTLKYIVPKLTKEQLNVASWKANFKTYELEVTVNE